MVTTCLRTDSVHSSRTVKHLQNILNAMPMSATAILLVLGATPAKATPTSAMDTPNVPAPADTAQKEETSPGDIIVTAQRRSQRLQDVPIAVTALGGEELSKSGIRDLTDLRTKTPGLYVGTYTFSRPQLYIRGIGTRQYDAGSEASIGVLQDEIYIARISNLNSDFFDVDRVEVLKGPQGTLYGRNTAGGAIAVYTRNPTVAPEAYASISLGNLGLVETEGAASGPIAGDKLLGRIAFKTSNRDGYLRNLATGRDQNGIDSAQIRAKLLWKASDRLDIQLRGEYSHDDPIGVQGKAAGPGLFLSRPGLLAQFTPDPRSDYYSTDSVNFREMGTGSVHATYEGESVDVTAIGAFHEGRIFESRDVDATAADVYVQESRERTRQETLEVRLSSAKGGGATLGGRLTWQIGAFYLHDRTRRKEDIIGGSESFYAYFTGLPRFTTTVTADIETTSYAFYGTGTLALTDRLNLTLGGRYSRDRKGALTHLVPQLPGVPGAAPAEYTTFNRKSWGSFDPRVTLDYRLNDDLMFFATYSTGFKSGGFQYLARTAAAAGILIEPEDVKYYELGMKSQWLDRRLTLNANIFKYDYKNLQLTSVIAVPGAGGGTQTLTSNAASSTIKGFEIEGRAQLASWFDVNYGYTYLDARYDDYIGPDNVDFSGVQMVRAPRNSFNLGGDVHFETSGGINSNFRVDWAYYSSFNHEPAGTFDPAQREDAYHLVNISQTFESGPWQLTGWVRNVGNILYRSTILQNPKTVLFGAHRVDFFAPPRTYGVTLKRSF